MIKFTSMNTLTGEIVAKTEFDGMEALRSALTDCYYADRVLSSLIEFGSVTIASGLHRENHYKVVRNDDPDAAYWRSQTPYWP